jgi:cobalt-zinc-cadmium efflux system membrane fusion protein
VLTPFSGRVTRLIAKPGDEVKRGDPLFEIDSPEVLQAHTDFIAAVQAAAKSKAQLSLAQRALDRQTGLFADHATSQREQARNDFTAAESDVRTTESVMAGARNRLRVLMGRSEEDLQRVDRDRVIDSLVISRKIGPASACAATRARRCLPSPICRPCGSKPTFRRTTFPLFASGRRSR